MAILPLCIVLGFLWVIGTARIFGRTPGMSRWLAKYPAAKLLFLPPVIIVPVTGIFISRARRRSLDELVAADGRLCLNCRYPVSDTSPKGKCSECGEPSDIGSLKRGWCRTYHSMAYEIDWPASRRDSGSDVRPESA
jgi:hypothetical protein